MSLIYKKEDQITKSANELQELIQGEPCPKISFEELLYDFIDKHPGIGINEIQTEFSQFGNLYMILDTLQDIGELCHFFCPQSSIRLTGLNLSICSVHCSGD